MADCRLTSFAGLLVIGVLAGGPAVPQQTRKVGPQPDGSIVASDNQLLTPAGTVVHLGSPLIAKAAAVNPAMGAHSAAVLLMSAAQPVIVFDTVSGRVLQRYVPMVDHNGILSANPAASFTGITYTPDGARLLFCQDNGYVVMADVDRATGELIGSTSVTLPRPPANPALFNTGSSNPGGLAVTPDGRIALVALNADNTVGVIDLAAGRLIRQIPVGNAPNSIVIRGTTAYVSNEGGRPAAPGDFTNLSDGTPIVADRVDAFATTGTVSVIDLGTMRQTATIDVGLHPAGMALDGGLLFVANSFSDSISVIDTGSNRVVRTIDVGVPVPGGAFGAGPSGIAVGGGVAYVTLGQANAVAVIDLGAGGRVTGYIPTLYFPTTISLDAAQGQLIVADDKGTGDQGAQAGLHGVFGYNTRQESGAVSLIPVPDAAALRRMTAQVFANNGWIAESTKAGPRYGNPRAVPVAVPAHAGEPSLIKHVFLFIKENRTYDQILGDLKQGNGDADLAIFARDTPNQHEIVKRFPLLDNAYAPSRQSADGHPWIVESGSFYANDIQSADWIRSYPGGNANDALTYTPRGFLWSGAEKARLRVKMYGEWTGTHTVAAPARGGAYGWADFYNTHLYDVSGGKQGAPIVPPDADSESTDVPSAAQILDAHYPSFDLAIPDQYRADYYIKALRAQDAADQVPNLTIIWLPDDHTNGVTTGYPLPANYQADNDLALGRMVAAISRTKVWSSSAIFVEEDDSQDGVDHVDGHRQPVFVISPYTVPPQAPGVGRVIHTTYTQENINRTIENILGLQPLTQFDLVAAPMFDVFQNTPDAAPFTAVPAKTPLNIGPGGVPLAGTGPAKTAMGRLGAMERAWNLASDRMTKGRADKADSVDEDFLNHAVWYSATRWARAYPGEAGVLAPSQFFRK